MSENTESIEELRARLARLEGPARAEPLSKLALQLARRVTEGPLGSPSARADLDEAIRCQDELYGYFHPGDPNRPQVAALLGYLIAFRASQSTGGIENSRAIALIEEALAGGHFAVPYLSILRVLLAMMLIQNSQRRMMEMGSPPIDMPTGPRSPAAMPDIDRAERVLRTVRETSGVSADIADLAEMMAEICELVRSLLGVSAKPMDPSAMQGMFGRVADLQRRFSGSGAGLFGMMRNVLEPGAGFPGIPPEDMPALILEDSTEESADTQFEPGPAAAPRQPTQDELLRSLAELLSFERDDLSAWNTVAQLLLPDSDPLDVDTVDKAVALAGEVVESEETELSEEDTALARFVYAVALCLRQRKDSETDGTDYEFGAQALLSASRALPADHPGAPVVLRSLGAFLDAERPLGGLDALAAGFTGRFDAVLATGNPSASQKAELHALRCAFRLAFAAAELTKAVEALPADYPWSVPLKVVTQRFG